MGTYPVSSQVPSQLSLLGESLEMKLPSELAKEAKHYITDCFLLFEHLLKCNVFPCWCMAGDLSVPSTLLSDAWSKLFM